MVFQHPHRCVPQSWVFLGVLLDVFWMVLERVLVLLGVLLGVFWLVFPSQALPRAGLDEAHGQSSPQNATEKQSLSKPYQKPIKQNKTPNVES